MAIVRSQGPIKLMLGWRQAGPLEPRQCFQSLKPWNNIHAHEQAARPASTSTQSTAASTAPIRGASTFPKSSAPMPFPQGAFASTSRRSAKSHTAQPLNLWTTIKSVFGWKPAPAPFVPAPFTAINNPYRARKKWPPDFTTLHPKHQFYYEKTYRRRLKLKYARPNWVKATKVFQYVLTLMVVGFWIFFLEVEGTGGTFFDAVSGSDPP